MQLRRPRHRISNLSTLTRCPSVHSMPHDTSGHYQRNSVLTSGASSLCAMSLEGGNSRLCHALTNRLASFSSTKVTIHRADERRLISWSVCSDPSILLGVNVERSNFSMDLPPPCVAHGKPLSRPSWSRADRRARVVGAYPSIQSRTARPALSLGDVS